MKQRSNITVTAAVFDYLNAGFITTPYHFRQFNVPQLEETKTDIRNFFGTLCAEGSNFYMHA